MPDGIVTLDIAGRAFGGWKEVSIKRSIENFAGGFELALTERYPRQVEIRPVRTGESCKLRIDGTTVITGYVGRVAPGYDDRSHSIKVRGRDAAGDLVDCSAVHKPGEWNGRRLEDMARELCAPFKIPVKVETDTGKPFDQFRLNEGETVAAAIERMCRHRGVLRVSDGQGGIVLTRAGKGRAPAALELGKNIRACEGDFDDTERFSEYIVKGQRPGADFLTAEAASAPQGRARDPDVSRYRPKLVLAEDAGDDSHFAVRANWEANIAKGRARRAKYTVQGWYANGQLWSPNTLVHVRDGHLGVDGDFLIVDVTFKLGEPGGSTTEISVCGKEAFDLIPLPQTKGVTWTL